ncbi:hypothetical protein V8C35DRAFT_317087 [Trichoderma chlorosporum]
MACSFCHLPLEKDSEARIFALHDACAGSPSQSIQEQRTMRKRKATQFSKRRKTLLQKTNDMYKHCNVDVYLAIRNRHNNHIWIYSNGYKPPTESELTTVYPLPKVLGPADFDVDNKGSS